MIVTSNLSREYGAKQALVDLDLRVAAGEILGFLGPQRRRQVDNGQNPDRHDPSDEGARDCGRVRRGRAAARNEETHRLRAGGCRPLGALALCSAAVDRLTRVRVERQTASLEFEG